MSNQEAALSVQGLTAGYGGPPIIDQVSLTARRGAITAIVGPNGAGKSTLLKAVAGLIRPTAGGGGGERGESRPPPPPRAPPPPPPPNPPPRNQTNTPPP